MELGFKVLVFASSAAQKSTYCSDAYSGAVHSGLIDCNKKMVKLMSQGDFESATVVLYPYTVIKGSLRRIEEYPKTVTHEFGHVFGLFDQYFRSDVRYSKGVSTIESIMGYTSERVTSDDIAGILSAEDFSRRGLASYNARSDVRATPVGKSQGGTFCRLMNLGLSPGANSHE